MLEVFDISDPDWTLVGVNGEYGFAPSNYIELQESSAPTSPATGTARPVPSVPAAAEREASLPASPIAAVQSGPAAALARVLGGGDPTLPSTGRSVPAPRQQLTPEASDGEDDEPAPALPQRPASQSFSPPPPAPQFAAVRDEEPLGVLPSPPYNRATSRDYNDDVPARSPGGYRMYNINEMVSAMGRRRKMPITLGLNLATGAIMLSPEKSRDGPSQEWSADQMTHYSIEAKHVFIELIRPSKSLDLHAGTKDTAEEIVSALGELAGAARAGGLREIVAAAQGGGGQKKGQVLYDFEAQGDDEVAVTVGDDVIILDDVSSEEWWNVRRLKNGKEGVVPCSYIEVTGTIAAETGSRSGINAGRSTIEQNRLDEQRLAKEAAKSNRPRGDSDSEVGPGMRLPQRGSSLADEDTRRSSKKDRRASKSEKHSAGKPLPDKRKLRQWTDRTGTFKVEAQFLDLTDGKIQLHKINGVKIAVPTSKMSVEDLEYVERATGVSLDEDKPLENIRRKNRMAAESDKARASRSGATVEAPKPPEYEWFDFFLKAGVNHHQCERYAQNMNRDSMDETVLPDVTPEVLRTLGLKEGDILKVMKYLDNKFNRTRLTGTADTNGVNGSGGLFTGPDGGLQNNTRRARPDTNRQASNIVDPKVFTQANGKEPSEARPTPLTSVPAREKVENGFEDDAWDVKPPKQSAPAPHPTASAPAWKPLTGALADLDLLSTPLQPTKVSPQPAPQPVQQQQTPQLTSQPPPPAPLQVQQSQPTGANPNFFSQLNPQQTGLPQNQLNPPRQRPQPPQQNFQGAGLLPPPQRPLSAPQNQPQQSQFGLLPLQPQLTGVPQNTQPAPPGHSLNDLNQQRYQQQYQQQMQKQQTGFQQQYGIQPQQTVFQQQFPGLQPQQQGFMNDNVQGSPFADPRPSYQPSLAAQQTGFQGFLQPGPAPGSLNSVLPPALQPQPTGFQQPQQTGFQQPQPGGFGQAPQHNGFQQPQQTGFGQPPQQNGFGNFQPPPIPPMPQQNTPAPLQPQKTGPAPPVRFGVAEPPKLTPQPTGRRANLSHASKLLPITWRYIC